MKALVVILHFNSVQYTDVLYRQLKPYEREDYTLLVLDNGSEQKSVYATIELPQNTYFGGGLNAAFHLMKNPEYDALLFLNSDLIVHGYYFVRSLLQEMLRHDLTLLSPHILYPQEFQYYWRQMHHWGSGGTRWVRWLDFQAPLIHRRLIEALPRLPYELRFGWGLDLYCALACEARGWKMGVTDLVPAIHFGAGSFQDNQHLPEIREMNLKAEQSELDYFQATGQWEQVHALKQWAWHYAYPEHSAFV
ncbi:hypothetical protein COW36_21275 [bacterium (Candidatus Blackallbacteria) CG17_big_fil_post_rev_8_21_14_2_50_48_46]|uniref:Glycosyltransferase 2-like domain-containing protein n=1 Tax=bacterium (Candidatus Blackallbacteria) CG17_big_fil_post_rev_8_21_14_2_50_48_46 TaxID=2014261 RepID=A0A2M7FZ67_9BACT|nr:MAG: hypothetical protein COW64_14585 [bacterium (Candidatus Blackallbacteria) CG18_big_fil_WC_8_21_14_2_50_49_26]PIW14572.1 MAG: hypothetical protein COW36_21275 [bacterium (Candidatus Blackallbacteria) CG17_big_fil_post_rev_8_21_14_2_50_48_46]PIW47257.1 MAG: hypothetical protein COW20_13720 [bacterium (Candidatus Blackallbacteria) CG13_big_fil_rev_8_21_14_2_50_49_14]